FGVLPAWINSQTTLASLDENTVRCVPAIAGVGLILVMFLLAGHLGWAVVLIISFLIAISPALVFYSRYFIHEILLILFNAGLIITLFRYFLSAKVIWVLLAGLFTGLMISTK